MNTNDNQSFLPMPEQGILQILPNYTINLEPCKTLVLHLAFTLDKPAKNFTHQTVLQRQFKVFEFKHFRQNGSKFWTRKAGITLSFAVDKGHIRIKQKQGYSFPILRINGQEVRLNVSGGSGPNGGWQDWIGTEAETCVNLPLRTVAALAQVAINKRQANDQGIVIGPGEQLDIQEKAFLQNTYARQHCLKHIQPGHQIEIRENFSAWGAQSTGTVETRTGKRWSASFGGIRYSLGLHQIDWTKTAAANQWLIGEPDFGAKENAELPEPTDKPVHQPT